MIRIAGGLLAGALLIGAAEPPWNWGDTKDRWNEGYAESKAVCRNLRARQPPEADRARGPETAALKGCDSEALYYGIGMKADPVKARQCALIEAQAADPSEMQAPFAGNAMLMTIYANGVGAARDLDLATSLACRIDGAPAESDGRVLRLQRLKTEGWTGSDFHYCDDVTSGLAMGWCAGHGARIEGAARGTRIAALVKEWSTNGQAAFVGLRAAQGAYAEAHSDGEIDASGTMRGVFWTAAGEKRAEEMVDLLEQLAGGTPPLPPASAFAAADKALNAAYRERLAAVRGEDHGTVTTGGVRTAQRAWLRYRDAFLAFAAAQYPAVPRDSLAAQLTRLRTEVLLGEEDGMGE
jgi:hypothetical protein